MTKKTISLTTDYLIIGAGTMGMCFLDELINNSSSLEAIIVDQRDKPGGHWNDAYSFVRLHQPAVTYGVNSRQSEALEVRDLDVADDFALFSAWKPLIKP